MPAMKAHIRRCPEPALVGLLAALAAPLATTPAGATEVGTTRPLGVGLALGEPTGLVGKLIMGPASAIDAGLAFWSTFGRCHDANLGARACHGTTNVSLNGDYLWVLPLFDAEVKMDMHLGGGARIWLYTSDNAADNLALAGRAPFGVDFAFHDPAFLEAYIELAPALVILPGVYFTLEWTIGARYYF